MFEVALTGNVASGKSTVAGIWTREGVPVLRADDLARQAVAPGTVGMVRVLETFGEAFRQEDGFLDRAKLRGRVFGRPHELKRLEEILHPLIRSLRDEWLADQGNRNASLVVVEIPLLFEVGMEGNFDAVVLVVAPPEERLRRLMDDRELGEEEASRMMESQIPSAEKLSRADYVLENGGTRDDLEIRSLALLDLLRARARRGGSEEL